MRIDPRDIRVGDYLVFGEFAVTEIKYGMSGIHFFGRVDSDGEPFPYYIPFGVSMRIVREG